MSNRSSRKKNDFAPIYRGMAYGVLKFEERTPVKKNMLATNEASDGKRPPPNAAVPVRLFLPAPARRLSLLGSLGWLTSPGAPRGQQRWGCSDRTSEQSRDLIRARVVWEAKRDENTSLRRPRFFGGAADGVGCAKGPRRSRCNCSGDPTFAMAASRL